MINGTVVIKGPPAHAAVTVRDSNKATGQRSNQLNYVPTTADRTV
jgi:hypothetical protein